MLFLSEAKDFTGQNTFPEKSIHAYMMTFIYAFSGKKDSVFKTDMVH